MGTREGTARSRDNGVRGEARRDDGRIRRSKKKGKKEERGERERD